MNYAALRAFHAVASAGGFTRAAARLGVTQPTISAQVKAMEDRYGTDLFTRRGRRVALTAIGRQLFQATQRLFEAEAETESILAGAERLSVGQLALGADSPHHVMAALADYTRHHPGIAVAVTTGSSDRLLRDLHDLRLDLAVLADPPVDARLVTRLLGRHPLAVLLPASHRLARRRSLRLRDLAGERAVLREAGSITRALFERAAATAGEPVRAAIEIDSREGVREAVAAGLGYAVMSAAETGIDPRIAAVPLAEPDLAMTEHLVWLADRRPSKPAQAFIDRVAPGRAAAQTLNR